MSEPFFNSHFKSRELDIYNSPSFPSYIGLLSVPWFLHSRFVLAEFSPCASGLSGEISTDENADRIRSTPAHLTSPAFLHFRSYLCPGPPVTIFHLRIGNRCRESYHINIASSMNTYVPLLTCIRASVLSRTGRSPAPAPAVRPIDNPETGSNGVLRKMVR
jgi:hypothetical protein